MYVRCVFVQYAAVCHDRRFVCVSGAPVMARSGHDIWPHTAQTHNERTATEFNLVTAQSTAHEPPEDGRTYRPKHVGANLL
jgi:hypothetical protein